MEGATEEAVVVEAASELELTQTQTQAQMQMQVEPAQRLKDDGKLRSLWRNRDFMLLWGGQSVSVLGSTMSQIAFPLLVLAITGSPLAAGIAGALYSIPYILFSLPAGALIDRWDRKRVMILCDTGRAINMATIPIAAATNSLTEWQLYFNAFVEGSLFVWFNIAEVACLPRVVAREQLPNAAAQNEVTYSVAGLIGPSLGGFLYQSVGRAIPFLVDAISYAVSVVSLLFIKTKFQGERAQGGKESNLRAEIAEGVGWLWRHPIFRFMGFAAGVINFIYAGALLMIIVIAKDLGAGEAAIGTIFSIGAIGGIAGAIVGPRIQRRFSYGQVVIGCTWLGAILFPMYAFAPSIFALGAISAVVFFIFPIYNVVVISYRLAQVPDELQGRVNSAARLLVFGFQPLGQVLAGLLLERIGGHYAILLYSVVYLVLAVVTNLNANIRYAPAVGTRET